MSHYQNPYCPADPDVEESVLARKAVIRKLEGCLLNVRRPVCVSIVAERGMGGQAAVQQFLHTNADRLRFRVVECEIKVDLGHGKTAADFYRALVSLILRRLDGLPDAAHRSAQRLAANTSDHVGDLEEDLLVFFQTIKESGPPLLLTFYSFDRLPYRFTFDSDDWTLLREFHNSVEMRVYYLIVSRRALGHIEKLHGLERSLFATIFVPQYRVGPLSDEEIDHLIAEAAHTASDRPTWPTWLVERIREWGGRNLLCTEYICFDLFDRIYIQGDELSPSDASEIARQLRGDLRAYFDRLYDNLVSDNLLRSLVRAIELGLAGARSPEVTELLDLGYLLPAPKRQGYVVPFSPLFRDYLIQRGDLTAAEPPPPPLPPPQPIPKRVQDILNLQSPSTDVLNWFHSFLSRRTRVLPKPEVDRYTLLYLTGCEMGLTDKELNILRLQLYQRYRNDCEDQNDPRDTDGIRTYFYTECTRWYKRFKDDAPAEGNV